MSLFKNWKLKIGNFNKGFTLIELLVVIAIIGILSSVVLASLNTARKKGADAAAKAGLSQLRVQAEIYYDDPAHNNYGASGDNCSLSGGVVTATGMFNETQIKAILDNIGKNTTILTCASTGDTWQASVTLKGGDTWCVNSVGKSDTTC